MKDFFFYSAPTSPRSSSSSPFHYNTSLFDYDDDDVAVLDGVPLLRHHHRPLLSSSESTTCDHNRDGNEDEDVLRQKLAENKQDEGDYEFDFSGQLSMMTKPSLSSADELFDGGKIRPLKLKSDNENSQMGLEDQHPFEAASRCSNRHRNSNDGDNEYRGRGRGRATANPNVNASNSKGGDSNSRRGISRSLSPLRVSEFALYQHQHQHLANSSSSSSSSSRKWRLKDLFLFRSASEGHYKDTQSYSKRWSFRSSAIVSGSGSGSGSGSESKRRGQVQASAHEMHYTTKRAVSEEMKKKTSLPYKHGLMACLGFSPILPQFSYTFPSSTPTLS